MSIGPPCSRSNQHEPPAKWRGENGESNVTRSLHIPVYPTAGRDGLDPPPSAGAWRISLLALPACLAPPAPHGPHADRCDHDASRGVSARLRRAALGGTAR